MYMYTQIVLQSAADGVGEDSLLSLGKDGVNIPGLHVILHLDLYNVNMYTA